MHADEQIDTATDADGDRAFRSVTAEEVAHYQMFGWVKREKFMPAASVAAILAFARDRMGDDGSRTASPGAFPFFNALPVRDLTHPDFGPAIRHFGESAIALRNMRVSTGMPTFASIRRDRTSRTVPAGAIS